MAEVSSNWLFVDSPDSVEFQTSPTDANQIQARGIRTFTRRKIYTGASGVKPTDIGTVTSTAPVAYTGALTLTGAGETGRDWICTSDDIRQIGPAGTDAVERVQMWITYTEWENISLETAP
jgi:hypothetical protein